MIGLLALGLALGSCNRLQNVRPDDSGVFIKLLGGALDDRAFSIIENPDGSFTLVGTSTRAVIDANRNVQNSVIIRLDANGNPLWNENLSGYEGRSVAPLPNNQGFLVFGDIINERDTTSLYLIGTNAQGQEQWSRTYGLPSRNERGFSIVPAPNNQYLLLGMTIAPVTNQTQMYAVRTDIEGNVLRERIYGFTGVSNNVGSIIQTNNGDVLWCGDTFPNLGTNSDARLVLTDSLLNLKWDFTYGGAGNETARDVKQTFDGYIIVGSTETNSAGGRDVWLLKVDLGGQLIWQRNYGGTANDEGFSVTPTRDGGFLIVGYTESKGQGGQDIWVIKTDFAGDPIWDKTFGGTRDDQGRAGIEPRNGGFLIIGTIFFENNQMMTVIRTDANGNIVK